MTPEEPLQLSFELRFFRFFLVSSMVLLCFWKSSQVFSGCSGFTMYIFQLLQLNKRHALNCAMLLRTSLLAYYCRDYLLNVQQLQECNPSRTGTYAQEKFRVKTICTSSLCAYGLWEDGWAKTWYCQKNDGFVWCFLHFALECRAFLWIWPYFFAFCIGVSSFFRMGASKTVVLLHFGTNQCSNRYGVSCFSQHGLIQIIELSSVSMENGPQTIVFSMVLRHL